MDKGHENLINDIKTLLAEAEAFEFHDFKNKKYPAPKAELSSILYEFRLKVQEGKYDN